MDMLRLLQLTDTHIVTDPDSSLYGINTTHSLEQVLDHIQQHAVKADAVLVTGDLVHDEGEAAYRKLQQILSRLQVPVHYLPGNHDNADVLHACLPNSPASGLYHFTALNWLVVMLDSSAPELVEGYMRPEILTDLHAILDANRHRHILIAVHHHPVKTGSEWMDRIGISNGDDFITLLQNYPNVKLVINGHIHQVLEKAIGHFTVLGTPSTCVQFKANSSLMGVDDLPPGYRILDLFEDGGFVTRVMRLPSLR